MPSHVGILSTVAAVFVAASVYVGQRAYNELKRALSEAIARRNRLALQLMSTRNSRMHSEVSVRAGREFKPKPTDVFVVTYPKCGTTWVTQIVHALRTRASMDFGEITEVVPWDILAADCKQDLDAPQVAQPRVFKSHEGWKDVAKGGRYIYVARNPEDAFWSFFKFLPSFAGLRSGDIDEETFMQAIFAGASHSGLIWHHFLGWWEQRRRPDVLWVLFEDLTADLRSEVVRIASFVGIDADDALIDDVVRVSSFAFMSAPENRHHYDESFTKSHVYRQMGLEVAQAQDVIKVNRGQVGSRRSLPASLKVRLAAKWDAVLAGPTGCANYDAFAEKVRRLRTPP